MLRVHTDHGKSSNFEFKFSRPGKSWNQAKVLENQPNGCQVFYLCTPKPIWYLGSTQTRWGGGSQALPETTWLHFVNVFENLAC